MIRTTRRSFVLTGAAGGLAAALPIGSSLAAHSDARFLLVILSGGLDGLAALPPVGDPHLEGFRARFLEAGHLELAGQDLFALHPELTAFQRLWDRREMLALHATGTPYRERSHFDAQNVLESGLDAPSGTTDGWLNRAIASTSGLGDAAMAIGHRPPLVMQGATKVGSWSPNGLPDADGSTIERVAALWADDPLLAPHIARAIEQQSMTASLSNGMGDVKRARRSIVPLLEGAADLMARADGPRIVALDNAGWDTHVRQINGLGLKLRDLNEGIASAVRTLRPVWDRTVIMIVTEFGRTVAINGNEGTDHGNGAAAFLLGGAVNGGRVIADWPGLDPHSLLDGRDLRVTLDIRQVFERVMAEHVGLPGHTVRNTVFPGLGDSRGLDGLFRTA